MAKEIIIDEIDVSGCVDYGLFGCCYHYDNPCKEHSDCYFKKRKRKEQEFNQLKAENEKLRKTLDEICDQMEQFKFSTMVFHAGKNIPHVLADIVEDYANRIMSIVKRAKGEE